MPPNKNKRSKKNMNNVSYDEYISKLIKQMPIKNKHTAYKNQRKRPAAVNLNIPKSWEKSASYDMKLIDHCIEKKCNPSLQTTDNFKKCRKKYTKKCSKKYGGRSHSTRSDSSSGLSNSRSRSLRRSKSRRKTINKLKKNK